MASFVLRLTRLVVVTLAMAAHAGAQALPTPALRAAPTAKPSTPAPGPAAPSAAGATEDLSVSLWLDSDQLEENTTARLWIAIRNPHPTATRSVSRIQVQTPGFSPVGACWTEQSPACLILETTGTKAPWSVAPGGTLMLSGDVERRTVGAGTFLFSASYDWVDGASVRRGAVEPVKVTVLGGRPFGIPREWLDFLKDLILPVTLLYVAWILQRKQQTRAERQVVWSNMLSKVHQNAEKYYLPASMAMQALGRSLERLRPWSSRSSADFDPAMLPLLIALKRMRLMVRRIGGFYFKNRRGERAVARSWEMFYHGTRGALDIRALDFLVDAIEPFESEAAFAVRKTDPTFNADYVTVRDGLAAWAATGTLSISLLALDLCAQLFDTETNRAFEVWYEESEPMPHATVRSVREGMAASGPGALGPDQASAYDRLNAALDEYLSRDPER